MLQDGASVSLTIPADGFVDVARRVLGGAAGMADLGFEEIDDLQLALELVLRSGVLVGDSTTITIAGDPTSLTVRVGEVDEQIARRRLHREAGDRLGLGEMLGRMVDDVNLTHGGPFTELVLCKTLRHRAG